MARRGIEPILLSMHARRGVEPILLLLSWPCDSALLSSLCFCLLDLSSCLEFDFGAGMPPKFFVQKRKRVPIRVIDDVSRIEVAATSVVEGAGIGVVDFNEESVGASSVERIEVVDLLPLDNVVDSSVGDMAIANVVECSDAVDAEEAGISFNEFEGTTVTEDVIKIARANAAGGVEDVGSGCHLFVEVVGGEAGIPAPDPIVDDVPEFALAGVVDGLAGNEATMESVGADLNEAGKVGISEDVAGVAELPQPVGVVDDSGVTPVLASSAIAGLRGAPTSALIVAEGVSATAEEDDIDRVLRACGFDLENVSNMGGKEFWGGGGRGPMD